MLVATLELVELRYGVVVDTVNTELYILELPRSDIVKGVRKHTARSLWWGLSWSLDLCFGNAQRVVKVI